MIDYKFEDYISVYKNLNSAEWVTIYEHPKKKDLENDIFTFCALLENSKLDEDYLDYPEWNFSSDSFGCSGFDRILAQGKEQEIFYSGETYGEYEYLVALRHFEKYESTVEINPKLIWYKNLIKVEDGYRDPISDEIIIKVNSEKIEIQKSYLKDFLSAYKKLCVIVFDHRRYFYSNDILISPSKKEKNEQFCFNIFTSSISYTIDESKKINYLSRIFGKVIVTPFLKPRHHEFISLTKSEEFEEFIIGHDNEDEEVLFTCDEGKLANYFGANPHAPYFLTPTYFKITVLDKYKNDPRNYKISDSNLSFLSKWSIPFSINEENTVVVWLGDLGRIPYEEQKYWRSFNITPKGGIEKNFYERQINAKWTEPSRLESKLVPTISEINSVIVKNYGDILFKPLSTADSQIYNTFMLPTNLSIPEYQSFLMKFNKILAESINTKLIEKIMGDNYSKDLGSINKLGEFLKFIGFDQQGIISASIKKGYDSRNKLAGHSASFKEYNKIWKRTENAEFSSIEDATNLLRDVIGAMEYVLKESKN